MARYTEQDREEAALLFLVEEMPFEEIVSTLKLRSPKKWRSLCKKTLLDWASKPDSNGETWYTRRAKRVAELHRHTDLQVSKHLPQWIKDLTEFYEDSLAKAKGLSYGPNDRAGATHAALGILRMLMVLTGIGNKPSGPTVHIDQRQVIVYVDAVVDAFRTHPVLGPMVQQHLAEILETAKVKIRALEQGSAVAPPTIVAELVPVSPQGEA